jgi:hypothetical protein
VRFCPLPIEHTELIHHPALSVKVQGQDVDYAASLQSPSQLVSLISSSVPEVCSPATITSTKSTTKGSLTSPFRDCIDTFGTFPRLELGRPQNGLVNSYVKFRWPKTIGAQDGHDSGLVGNGKALSATVSAGLTTLPLANVSSVSHISTDVRTDRHLMVSLDTDPDLSPGEKDNQDNMVRELVSRDPSLTRDQIGSLISMSKPRFVPAHFGQDSKMDDMDRKFWGFYINNWCPGRSVLAGTNLWLRDFAPMHANPGVRSAIQSLAGVYIYDYVPQPSISRRINELFNYAEYRLTQLLNNTGELSRDAADELITIAVILSMQDVSTP